MSQRGVDVSSKPVVHLSVDISTGAVALKACGLQDTILVQVTEREHEAGLVSTAIERNNMLVTEGILASHSIQPVFVPHALSVGTHLTSSGINDVCPRIVLEGVIQLATKLLT